MKLQERLREHFETGERIGAYTICGGGKIESDPGVAVTRPYNRDGPEAAAQLDLYEAALRQAALDLHEAAGRFAIHSKLDMPSCAEATRNAARRADEALGATL